MKLLIDTNIILDVLCKRKGLYEDSAKIFKLCELRQMEGIISALSILILYTLCEKNWMETGFATFWKFCQLFSGYLI